MSWNSARLGTRPFVVVARNPTEVSSSDGPRKRWISALLEFTAIPAWAW